VNNILDSTRIIRYYVLAHDWMGVDLIQGQYDVLRCSTRRGGTIIACDMTPYNAMRFELKYNDIILARETIA
jgi:hypothetical protein